MVVRTPDSRLIKVPLMWRLMPPIRRTWVIVSPENDVAVPPVKIAIQPPANRKADAEDDEWRAIADSVKIIFLRCARVFPFGTPAFSLRK